MAIRGPKYSMVNVATAVQEAQIVKIMIAIDYLYKITLLETPIMTIFESTRKKLILPQF